MPGFLDNKLALVTGASRGIGAATAEALAREGAHVVLTARTGAGLEEVEDRIHAAGGSATIAPLDLVENDSIAKLAAAVGERWPALDVLVLNAATLGSLTPVPQIDGKEFTRVLTLNLLAQQALIAAFDPLLRKSAAGRLVAVTSSVARNPRAFWGAYGASKAALEAVCRQAAVEGAPRLRVNLLVPGLIDTALGRMATRLNPRRADVHIPLRRQGTAFEVAEAAVFLLSDAASYVTGTSLVVDGGLSVAPRR